MDILGYNRYVAHGDDLGGSVTVRLGTDFPDRVAAIQVGPNGASAAAKLLASSHSLMARLIAEEEHWDQDKGGYQHEQSTRPLTLGHALSDSPVALASWILEKWQAWSDCGGDLDNVVARPHLLQLLTLYWATDTAVTSFLPYWERTHLDRTARSRLTIPLGVYVTREPGIAMAPRELVQAVGEVASWVELSRGGHFLSLEQPAIATELIRGFLGRYR
jgi:pimeloyl-ACP methyl ester carboxylesterase